MDNRKAKYYHLKHSRGERGMSGTYTTVKELIDKLKEYPEDATVYHAETIDGEPQDMYLAVTDVFMQDGAVMIY